MKIPRAVMVAVPCAAALGAAAWLVGPDALREARTEGRRTALMRLNSGEAARLVVIPVDAV